MCLLTILMVFSCHFAVYAAYEKGLLKAINEHGAIGISPEFNPGTAYGIIKNQAVVYCLEAFFSIFLLMCFIFTFTRYLYFPLAFMFVGGFANFINRIISGGKGVFDYLKVDFGVPVFRFVANIPDVFITVGAIALVIGLFVYVIKGFRKPAKKQDTVQV